MDKRNEIREAIDTYTDDECLFPDRSCNALGSGYCSSTEEAYQCLMERLTQIGVVIKVERVGKCGYCKHPLSVGGNHCTVAYCICPECNKYDQLSKSGYTKTIPLIIKEEVNG